MLKKLLNDKINLIEDPISKIILCVGLPVLLASLLSIVSGLLNNSIFKAYCPNYFPVYSVVSYIVLFITVFYGSFVSIIWSYYSKSFVLKTKDINQKMFNSIIVLFFTQIIMIAILLACTNPLLKVLNTPAEIYSDVKIFYITYLCFSLVLTFSTFAVRVVDGLEKPFSILIINLVNTMLPTLILYLFVGPLNLGIVGSSMYIGIAGLIILIVCVVIMLKHKIFSYSKGEKFKLQLIEFAKIIKSSFGMIAQNVLCTVGYLLVVSQTNKYLSSSMDYLFVLGVTLPLTNVFSIFSTLTDTVIPANYMNKDFDRTKKLLRIFAISCVSYGFILMIFYVFFGKFYFASLCPGEETKVALGTEYWIYQGIGYFFVSFIYTFRIFFSSILRIKTAMVCGLCEFVGNVVAAYWLIPCYGTLGRNIAQPLGWAIAAVYLIIMYLAVRKKIYTDDAVDMCQQLLIKKKEKLK